MKRFIIMFLSCVLVFSMIVVSFFYIQSRRSSSIDLEEVPKDMDNIREPEKDFAFVLMGVDAEDKEDVKGQRTDTIMVCKYFSDTHKVSILSIPRDTLVNIPGLGEDKINHAHASGGPKLTLKTINKNFGLDIKYYVRVDYDLVEEVVDALNGVEVDVPMDMKYDDPYADPPLHINLKKGKQKLNGKKSLQFLRFRSGYVDQDLGRIKAQQQFITQVIEKAKNPIYVLKVPSLLKSTSENIETNISVKEILSYITAITKVNKDNLQVETLPVDPVMIDDVAYVTVREDELEDLFRDLFERSIVTKKEKKSDDQINTEESNNNQYSE